MTRVQATEIATDRPIAVVGNPPFCLAIKFFNHAAKQAEVIAMIVPCTFRREGVLRQLDDYFHLKAEMEVPAWAFLRDGRRYDVPALLQTWERRSTRRVKPPKRTYHADFTFTSPEDARFAVQRIGVRTGLVHQQMHRSGEAHLFVKVRNEEYSSYVEAMFNSIDMRRIAKNTLGGAVRQRARDLHAVQPAGTGHLRTIWQRNAESMLDREPARAASTRSSIQRYAARSIRRAPSATLGDAK